MQSSSYRFVERWEIPDFLPDEVWSVVADPRTAPVWWEGVYRHTEIIFPGGGRTPYVEAIAGGWLPYTLEFTLHPLRAEAGRILEVEVRGDFEGCWCAVFSREGAGTRVDITWEVTVHKPLVRDLSWLLKPLFAWNHRWTTEIGEDGLIAYLAARRDTARLAS
jgi:hypothetical protein